MSKDTISVNMNVYDIPIVVEQLKKLEQENKQLKEDFAVLKKLQMISNDILNELEEWLKEIMKIYEKDVFDIVSNAIYNQCEDTLNKIQELKEKYK